MKRIIPIIICLVILISAIPVSAYDSGDPVTTDMYQYISIPALSSQTYYMFYKENDDGSYNIRTFNSLNNANECYLMYYRNSSNSAYILIFAPALDSTSACFGYSGWNNHAQMTRASGDNQFSLTQTYVDPSGNTWKYQFCEFNWNGFTIANNVSYFETKQEATDAMHTFIDNGAEPIAPFTGNNLEYSLPAGNIAIIETLQSYTYLNLSTVMPLQSTSFANNPWPNTTQRIGMYNTLPSALNPSTMGNVIAWQKSGNASLFGITTSATYSENVVSTFKYIVICNPFYYPANDMEDSQYTNGNINISMDGVVNITVKNLTATVNTNTGEVENNENGSEWSGTIDPETGGITWTNQDGEPTTPTSGGNLSDPSISGFQSWLKSILQSIISIFEPAHDAIQTLSGAVGNFANWLYALYIWLPTSILSVLKAAITLSIVIGVIKVFI